jgi:hypothetical protein
MRYLSTLLILVSITLGASQSALAWNKAGHMVSGAIAFRELKDSDPQALGKVIEIFKSHPDYQTKWLPAIKKQIGMKNHDQYVFMFAARWADDIRDNPDLHCGSCHFINYPFRPSGQPDSVTVKEPQAVNVEQAFEEKLRIAKDSNSNPADRAMAIAWIFHLVGDVHQPLHTSALFTTDFPNGDMGGNIFFIRLKADQPTKRLHSLWDGLVIDSERFQAVSNKAAELRSRTSHKRAALRELSERDFHHWSKEESFWAAKVHAYRSGTLKGSTDENNGEVLPSDYINVVKPLAERRCVLAGYRLADILKDIVD